MKSINLFKRIVSCFLFLTIMASLFVSCLNNPSDASSINSNSSVSEENSDATEPNTEQTQINSELIPNGDELLRFGYDLDIDTEFVEASYLNGILKIDFANGGLNAADITTVTFSLFENKILGQTDLPEKPLATGSYDNGFYAAMLEDCEIVLFDNLCNEVKRIKPDDGVKLWAFAEMSSDAKYIIYGDAVNAEIFIYSVEQNTSKKVGSFSGYMDRAGTHDNFFYLKNSMGELMCIGVNDDYIETIIIDNRLNFITPYYCLGTIEDEFIAVSAEDPYNPMYTAFCSKDEVPVAAGRTGFITREESSDGGILRVYNMKEATRFEIKIPEYIYQVLYLNDNTLLIITKEQDKPDFKFYLHNAVSASAEEINISNKSRIDIEDEQKWEYVEEIENQSIPPQSITKIDGVPIIAQMPEYPTGCESVSTVMAMQYSGEDISVDDFIDNYLEYSEDFYIEGDELYGPDPREVFAGNPRTKNSYGCMSTVIEKALNKYYDGSADIINATGTDLDELCKTYIDNDIPVLVWVSINMKKPYYSKTWHTPSGEDYTWLSREHCMVLIGYDDNCYYFNDPYTGEEVKYEKALSRDRFESFGKQSVIIKK